MQNDPRTSDRGVGKRDWRHRIGAFAIGRPLPGFLGPGVARDYIDFVRDHKSRIEPDAKLANECWARTLARFHLLQKRPGAGMSDGPKCLDQLITFHADAIVFNGERFLVGIDGKRDLEREIAAK